MSAIDWVFTPQLIERALLMGFKRSFKAAFTISAFLMGTSTIAVARELVDIREDVVRVLRGQVFMFAPTNYKRSMGDLIKELKKGYLRPSVKTSQYATRSSNFLRILIDITRVELFAQSSEASFAEKIKHFFKNPKQSTLLAVEKSKLVELLPNLSRQQKVAVFSALNGILSEILEQANATELKTDDAEVLGNALKILTDLASLQYERTPLPGLNERILAIAAVKNLVVGVEKEDFWLRLSFENFHKENIEDAGKRIITSDDSYESVSTEHAFSSAMQ